MITGGPLEGEEVESFPHRNKKKIIQCKIFQEKNSMTTPQWPTSAMTPLQMFQPVIETCIAGRCSCPSTWWHTVKLHIHIIPCKKFQTLYKAGALLPNYTLV